MKQMCVLGTRLMQKGGCSENGLFGVYRLCPEEHYSNHSFLNIITFTFALFQGWLAKHTFDLLFTYTAVCSIYGSNFAEVPCTTATRSGFEPATLRWQFPDCYYLVWRVMVQFMDGWWCSSLLLCTLWGHIYIIRYHNFLCSLLLCLML